MKRIARKTAAIVLAAAAALFALPAGAATDVTWTATPLTASSTSIRTDGTLKYAYARGDYTANGVAFTGVGNGIVNTENCVVWEASGGAGNAVSSPPSDTESGDYKNLLSNGWWANGKARPIALKNLESGKRYLVQIIAFRSDYTTQSATAPDGTTVARFAGTGWEYGGSLICQFTAEATTEEFTISYSGQALINAIQVRELPSDEPAEKPVVIFVK